MPICQAGEAAAGRSLYFYRSLLRRNSVYGCPPARAYCDTLLDIVGLLRPSFTSSYLFVFFNVSINTAKTLAG